MRVALEAIKKSRDATTNKTKYTITSDLFQFNNQRRPRIHHHQIIENESSIRRQIFDGFNFIWPLTAIKSSSPYFFTVPGQFVRIKLILNKAIISYSSIYSITIHPHSTSCWSLGWDGMRVLLSCGVRVKSLIADPITILYSIHNQFVCDCGCKVNL